MKADTMEAKDVMTHCVISLTPETPVAEAIARMLSQHVSGLPVIDARGQLVGIVTEGDFLRRAETHTEAPRRRWLELLLGPGRGADAYAHTHGRTVGDVMSTEVVSAHEETPISEVVRLMEEHAIKRVPVLDSNARVVGIVSRADLIGALAQYLSTTPDLEESDLGIRRKMLAEMRHQTWCPLQSVGVDVRNGVVTLKGTIFDERQRRALLVLAANVEGVKRVDDQLTWIEPMSGFVVESPQETASASQSVDANS